MLRLCVHEDNVPDHVGWSISIESWKPTVGLHTIGIFVGGGDAKAEESDHATEGQKWKGEDDTTLTLLPLPGFQSFLDDFLRGLSYTFTSCTTFGGITSTVLSLPCACLLL